MRIEITAEARLLKRIRSQSLPFTKRNFNLVYEAALSHYRFKSALDSEGFDLPDPEGVMQKKREDLQGWLHDYVAHHYSPPREKTPEEVKAICDSILSSMMDEED